MYVATLYKCISKSCMLKIPVRMTDTNSTISLYVPIRGADMTSYTDIPIVDMNKFVKPIKHNRSNIANQIHCCTIKLPKFKAQVGC